MDNKELVLVIAIALVIGVISSLATSAITGNIVKVSQNSSSNIRVYQVAEVYNKSEIQGMFRNINENSANLTWVITEHIDSPYVAGSNHMYKRNLKLRGSNGTITIGSYFDYDHVMSTPLGMQLYSSSSINLRSPDLQLSASDYGNITLKSKGIRNDMYAGYVCLDRYNVLYKSRTPCVA